MVGSSPDEDLKDRAEKAFASSFGAVLKIAPDDAEPLWIDGRQNPPKILTKSPGKVEEACTWRGACESLMRALDNERAATSAFVSGRIAISGDMSVMARLQLSGAR